MLLENKISVHSVRLARLLHGDMRQWKLARLAGLSQGRLSFLERHLITPTEEEKRRIAKALETPVDHLFPTIADGPTEDNAG